jgi:tRNA A-37 threonylcarbamoyl transferase component Bud32
VTDQAQDGDSHQDDEILADLLVRWEELREQGRDVSAIELCQNCPHLIDELQRRIDALQATAWLNAPLSDRPPFDPPPDLGTIGGESRVLADRYRLDVLIAEGGFAQVWRGYDLELQRVIAVKLPKPSRLNSKDAFIAEARRVARLKHPGIVPVFDAGRVEDTYFIVSEFVEAGSLGDQMKTSPPGRDKAVQWLAEIAEALEYAHGQGIIHRDIKPANILIDHHGRALLADFGIAHSSTKTGRFAPSLGTLQYMSPEQLNGEPVDRRSDLYSLGIVLHELLTGGVPYSSPEPNVLRREIAAGAQVTASDIPAELRRICNKALERDPNARYASAAEFAADLRRISTTGSGRRAVLQTTLAAVAVGLGTLWWTNTSSKTRRPPRRRLTAPRIPDAWFREVASMPAADQFQTVVRKLRERNPRFDGKVKHAVENGVITEMEFCSDYVEDLTPLRALPHLRKLSCFGTATNRANGALYDLSPLSDMQLTSLEIGFNEQIDDLTDIRHLPLKHFLCSRTKVADLSPLQGMPLTSLDIGSAPVSDLSPLRGMALQSLMSYQTQVADFSPLEGMPLEQIRCQDSPLTSIEALAGAPLKGLECHRTSVADLSPLRGNQTLHGLNVIHTKITDLWCTFVDERDGPILRQVKSLEYINDRPVELFWQDYDQRRSGAA